jgi:tetratricopeptide (TPR) repeat protein
VRAFEARYGDKIDDAWLGLRYEEVGLEEDALRHYRVAIENKSTEPLPYFKVGWAKFVAGDVAGSIESTREALRQDPTWAISEFNLGLAYLFHHDVQAAEDAYRRGLALARRQSPAAALEALHGAIGDFDEFVPAGEAEAVARVRAWLVAERERLGVET